MSVQPTDSFIMKNATAIALMVMTALTILVCAVFWGQVRTRDSAAQWVIHTYEVIGHLEQLSNNIREAVIGHRGYLLTGDEALLAPYHRAHKDGPAIDAGPRTLQQQRSIAQQLALIAKLTKDNPIQQQTLAELNTSYKNLQDYLEASIEARRAGQTYDTFPDNLKTDFGKQYMDEVRNLTRVMETEESNLLSLRREKEALSASMNARNTYIGIGLFYILLCVAIILYQRNRKRATAEAARYTIELEKREEELKMQQEELKASNEEIEASNEELEEKTSALENQNSRIREQSRQLEEAKSQIEEKAQELETASRYKSEFLANMSHELRTPLNSLLILARSFASNEEGNLTDSQIEEAKVIHNGGMELLSLINDILDLSKVEAGKLNINLDDIPLKDIAARLTQQFEPVARERGVSFNVKIEAGLPDSVHTDAQRIEQIIKNLLSNAFKFTEKGSVTLNIHAPEEGLELQRASLVSAQAVAFSVIDTGIGIEESKFRDIFEAFQQEDGSTERHYGGTGLGLTIARKFAHMLGGEIHVMSAKGKGSTFTLFLPQDGTGAGIADSRAPDMQEAKSTPPRMAMETSKKIESSTREFIADDRASITTADRVALVIEDDRNFAGTLVNIARQRGYKCLAAGDGKTGLVLAAEYPVTAIVLDLRLPDIHGTMVLDQLKHNLSTRHIPVHIISGADEQNVVPLRKGAIGYLSKPVTIEDVIGAFTRMESVSRESVKKVLVIEDDQKTQVAIQKLLKQKDIEIVICGSGKEALGKVQDEEYDCVILDLKLPDMSGFEWLESMEKQVFDDRMPPIIIYTAKELTEDENRKLNHYTDTIVIKGASSSERLLDEVTLFLHSVESMLSEDQKAIIRMSHDPDSALQNRKILLVDDDMRNTFALSKLLKKHGMVVEIADNGQMAIDKLKNDPSLELVIMDIMMPIMDGYQCMKAIREDGRWKDLPIIALTARAMPEEQERCMEAGANDYLTKPVDVERLLTLLRVWLFRQEKAA